MVPGQTPIRNLAVFSHPRGSIYISGGSPFTKVDIKTNILPRKEIKTLINPSVLPKSQTYFVCKCIRSFIFLHLSDDIIKGIT